MGIPHQSLVFGVVMLHMIDNRLNEIYDGIHALGKLKCFHLLHEMLVDLELKAWRTDLNILVGFANATLPFKNKLSYRVHFINKCKQLHPDPELWKGLD